MNLSERLAKNKGLPIDFNGQLVHSMYRRRIVSGTTFTVRRKANILEPVQGLRLKLQKGRLLVAGEEVRDAVLWADTAPSEVVVACRATVDTELRVWNCWRDTSGMMQAWIGDAGMIVMEEGPTVVLRCNYGGPRISFDHIVAELVFSPTT